MMEPDMTLGEFREATKGLPANLVIVTNGDNDLSDLRHIVVGVLPIIITASQTDAYNSVVPQLSNKPVSPA